MWFPQISPSANDSRITAFGEVFPVLNHGLGPFARTFLLHQVVCFSSSNILTSSGSSHCILGKHKLKIPNPLAG